MPAPPFPPYVSLVLGNEIDVSNYAALKPELEGLGFKTVLLHGVMRVTVATEGDKAALFSRLNDLGVAFSAGKEWCPSEVVAELKDRGLLSGSFTEIYWTAPGEWSLRKF